MSISRTVVRRTGRAGPWDQLRKDGSMSGVRVLVGTRKGAFVLTSDGKRGRWDVSGPNFTGWEIYHLKGSPADPNRLYASQTSGWFGQVIQRSCDGGKTWETPGGGVTMAPGGMPAGESNKFVYDTSRAAGSRHGAEMAAGRRRDVPAHDSAGPARSEADLRRDLGGGQLPHRRRRQDVETNQPWPALSIHPGPERRDRPLRPPHRDAPVASQRAVHAEALGRHALGRRRRLMAGDQRKSAHRLRVRDRRARARAGHDLRRPHQERLGALSARG